MSVGFAMIQDVGDMGGVFLGSARIAAGELTEHQLRHDYTRIYRDVYAPKRAHVTARTKAFAASLFAPDAVLIGRSACAMHGAKWIDASAPAVVARAAHFRSPRGLVVRRFELLEDEIEDVDGVRVATPARAAYDIGRLESPDRAIELIDSLCNATGLKPAAALELAGRHRGERGLTRLRSVLGLVDDGAESPRETRLRLALVRAGLPVPETQLVIADEFGRIFARADLGWREWKVLVEYDGEHHWTDPAQRAWDIERTPLLESLGWREIRVGSRLLANETELVRRVRAKLRVAGAPV